MLGRRLGTIPLFHKHATCGDCGKPTIALACAASLGHLGVSFLEMPKNRVCLVFLQSAQVRAREISIRLHHVYIIQEAAGHGYPRISAGKWGMVGACSMLMLKQPRFPF